MVTLTPIALILLVVDSGLLLRVAYLVCTLLVG